MAANQKYIQEISRLETKYMKINNSLEEKLKKAERSAEINQRKLTGELKLVEQLREENKRLVEERKYIPKKENKQYLNTDQSTKVQPSNVKSHEIKVE